MRAVAPAARLRRGGAGRGGAACRAADPLVVGVIVAGVAAVGAFGKWQADYLADRAAREQAVREGKAKDASRSLYQQQAASSNLAAKILTEEADGAAEQTGDAAD